MVKIWFGKDEPANGRRGYCAKYIGTADPVGMGRKLCLHTISLLAWLFFVSSFGHIKKSWIISEKSYLKFDICHIDWSDFKRKTLYAKNNGFLKWF